MRITFLFIIACLLFLIVSITVVSCKKEPINIPGRIAGYVSLYDENNSLIENMSGVIVTIESMPSFNATTDIYGKFVIDNVPSGTFNIDFTKQGFSETKQTGFSFVAEKGAYMLSKILCKPSTTTVKLVSLSIDSANHQFGMIVLECYSHTLSKNSAIARVFYGLSNSISYSNYDYSLSMSPDDISSTNDSIMVGIGFSPYNYCSSGTKVFVIAYGAPSNYSSYINTNTGKTIYPGLNPTPSQIMSIVLP